MFFGEEAGYAHGYASPMDLNATVGAVNTPSGPLGYIVWKIASGTPQEVMIEHWLNMHEDKTLRMLLEAGGQTHFKLVVYDIETNKLANMIEFENTFGLDSAAKTFAHLARQSEGDDFAAKQGFAMQNFTLADLVGKS